MFNNMTSAEFVGVVDSLRFRGRTWTSLDHLFDVRRGRVRRAYKSACNTLGIRDFHRYRHVLSY